ncbi:MAG: thioredoxin family protein [Bradymonadia bacterium]
MLALNEDSFDAFIEESSGLVLVDFWADWCGPCQKLTPVLEALEPNYEGQVAFCKVDIDANRRLADAFRIKSVPSVVLLKPVSDGPGARVVGHLIGMQAPSAYVRLIEKATQERPSLTQRLKRIFGAD